MKKKHKKRYLLLILIISIIVMIVIFYNNNNKNKEVTSTEYSETEVIKTDILNTLSNSSYVVTGLEEKKELHATYYFEEIYFKENQLITAGENILKYTNGTYLVAPYNCVITETSLPDSGEVCTNKHYITIQSTHTLEMSMQVDEDELDTVYVGQEARIEVEALENKTITGYVTNIDNTATYSSSGSKFKITVGFENDGEILLGMSAKCSIILEKAENSIAVAKEAVKEDKNKKYVIVKNQNEQMHEVEIVTGIENDAYIEVKSGLSEGEIVLIEETETTNSQRGMREQMQMDGGKGEFQGGDDRERPEIPSGGDMEKGFSPQQ